MGANNIINYSRQSIIFMLPIISSCTTTIQDIDKIIRFHFGIRNDSVIITNSCLINHRFSSIFQSTIGLQQICLSFPRIIITEIVTNNNRSSIIFSRFKPISLNFKRTNPYLCRIYTRIVFTIMVIILDTNKINHFTRQFPNKVPHFIFIKGIIDMPNDIIITDDQIHLMGRRINDATN